MELVLTASNWVLWQLISNWPMVKGIIRHLAADITVMSVQLWWQKNKIQKISCCAFGCHRNAKKDFIFIFIQCRSRRRLLKLNAGVYGCKPLSRQTGLMKPVILLKHEFDDYIIFTNAVHNVLALFEIFYIGNI